MCLNQSNAQTIHFLKTIELFSVITDLVDKNLILAHKNTFKLKRIHKLKFNVCYHEACFTKDHKFVMTYKPYDIAISGQNKVVLNVVQYLNLSDGIVKETISIKPGTKSIHANHDKRFAASYNDLTVYEDNGKEIF